MRASAVLLVFERAEKGVVGALLAFVCQAAVFLHRGPLGIGAAAAVEARRATVIGHVLELRQVVVDAAELVLVVVQRVHSSPQAVHRAGGLVPDISGRGHRVLELVFVLLELGLVLLDLLERLRDRLHCGHHVLCQIPAVDDGNTGLYRGCEDAAGERHGEGGFSR